MSVLVRSQAGHGYVQIIPPRQYTRFIELAQLTLDAGESFLLPATPREQFGVILSGQCDIRGDRFGWMHAGERANVFDGPASAFYLPPAYGCRIIARTPLQIVIAAAPATISSQPVFIAPGDIRRQAFGNGIVRRELHEILHENYATACLMAAEVHTPAGHWPCFPPHRHDTDSLPVEARLEEVSFFKFQPSQGFGFVSIYGDNLAAEARYLLDGDAIVIPNGYHAVTSAPGYRCYCLNILAGSTRRMLARDDPRHSWVLEKESGR